MFGFGDRKRFNGAVDQMLNNEYQIATETDKRFPSVNAFLSLLDAAWKAKMNENEAALYIATLFYCGLKKAGQHTDAAGLEERIRSVASFGLRNGTIAQERWDKFSEAIRQAG